MTDLKALCERLRKMIPDPIDATEVNYLVGGDITAALKDAASAIEALTAERNDERERMWCSACDPITEDHKALCGQLRYRGLYCFDAFSESARMALNAADAIEILVAERDAAEASCEKWFNMACRLRTLSATLTAALDKVEDCFEPEDGEIYLIINAALAAAREQGIGE